MSRSHRATKSDTLAPHLVTLHAPGQDGVVMRGGVGEGALCSLFGCTLRLLIIALSLFVNNHNHNHAATTTTDNNNPEILS